MNKIKNIEMKKRLQFHIKTITGPEHNQRLHKHNRWHRRRVLYNNPSKKYNRSNGCSAGCISPSFVVYFLSFIVRFRDGEMDCR